jgi:hypothetical protein
VAGDDLEDRARQREKKSPPQAIAPHGLEHEQRSHRHAKKEHAVDENDEITA